MAGDSFRLHTEGQETVERTLARVYARLGDLTPLMQDIGTQLESSTADNFKGEHSPAGVPWKKSQRAMADGGKTLQRPGSSRLALSITSRATASSVEVGTNVIYARRHNQGFNGTEQVPATRMKAHRRTLTQVFGVKLAEPREVEVASYVRKAHSRKGNTPQRQFLGLGPHDMEDIADLAAAHLEVEP